jgi:hypothetical protein
VIKLGISENMEPVLNHGMSDKIALTTSNNSVGT